MKKTEVVFLPCFLLIIAINHASAQDKQPMIEKTVFGRLSDRREVFRYSLTNESGTRVEIINYDAIATQLFVKDRTGALSDVASGYDSLERYVDGKSYFGAIVGRYVNRIGRGTGSVSGADI